MRWVENVLRWVENVLFVSFRFRIKVLKNIFFFKNSLEFHIRQRLPYMSHGAEVEVVSLLRISNETIHMQNSVTKITLKF